MWKSACVCVYQLLNWKIHGETLKFVNCHTSEVFYEHLTIPTTKRFLFLFPPGATDDEKLNKVQSVCNQNLANEISKTSLINGKMGTR